MQAIIVHGAPGCGKTTIASLLHERLKSPWFEFGWIPEFRQLNPHTEMSFAQEEQMTFETLMLVVKNYLRHGFENVILSDLNDIRILELPLEFSDAEHIIITLYTDDEATIRERILSRDNGNEYRNWEESQLINRKINARRTLPNEYRVCVDGKSPEDVLGEALRLIAEHKTVIEFDKNGYNREDYFSYTEK